MTRRKPAAVSDAADQLELPLPETRMTQLTLWFWRAKLAAQPMQKEQASPQQQLTLPLGAGLPQKR